MQIACLKFHYEPCPVEIRNSFNTTEAPDKLLLVEQTDPVVTNFGPRILTSLYDVAPISRWDGHGNKSPIDYYE